jgi:hypothetical protein
MNKYSLKIYNFIGKINKELKFDFSKLINIQDPFIIKIQEIINEVLDEKIDYNISSNEKISTISTISSKKIEPTCPLIYIFLKEYIEKRLKHNREIILPNSYYFKKNDLSFESFLRYYLDNSININYNLIKNDISDDSELIEIYSIIFEQKGLRKKLHDLLYANSFVGLDVTHYAETTELQYIKIDSDLYSIDLYFDNTFSNTINIQILKVITILTIMKKIADKFNLPNKKNKVKIRIILSRQKKSLYSNYNILGPINVNSGSTLPGEFVNIWRFEEFEKVMIHELQHFYGCDFHSSNSNYHLIFNVINNYFDIEGDDKVNESYNEVMAHIISMIYFSKVNELKLEDIYHSELYFLLFQTAKIIDFFGGDNYDSIFKSEKNHIIINQRTSVLSYYLIKTLFMFNIEYTTKFISKISMRCNDKESMELLGKFIKIIVDDKQIQKYINPLIMMIKKNKSDKFIYKTMRMTGIE